MYLCICVAVSKNSALAFTEQEKKPTTDHVNHCMVDNDRFGELKQYETQIYCYILFVLLSCV